MCGITGIISSNRELLPNIQNMVNSLHHRGPNANGIFVDEAQGVAIGHTRLSIIDLSVEANQPMHSEDQRYVISFNGEIYNFNALKGQLSNLFTFRTNSDTEVLLHAYAQWGADMLTRLDGMFAFAIYDRLEKKLFLARDRMGKKPLYYFHNDEAFLFASEIKTLLANPICNRKVDTNALFEFLHLGYIGNNLSIYKEVKSFPAGHYAMLSFGETLTCIPFWKMDQFYNHQSWKEEDPQIILKEKLISAVEKRLLSDVPLGCFLSGGIDSSIVSAIASKVSNHKLKSFSIGFTNTKSNELSFAERVAKTLNLEHHALELTEKDGMEIMETYLNHFDEPFADTSAVPTMLVSKFSKQQVSVALTGDGGDELFLGYGAYTWARRLQQPWVKSFRGSVTRTLFQQMGSEKLSRKAYMFDAVQDEFRRSHIFSQEQNFFSVHEINKLLPKDDSFTPYPYLDFETLSQSEEENQALYDLQHYLKDDLLVKVDRASMFYALECRCPLLDYDVISYALQLPLHYKRRGGVNKWILKEILREYLPEDLIHRPKLGFSIPLSSWLRNDLSVWIDMYLSKSSVEQVGLLQYAPIQTLVKSFLSGKDYLYHRIWVLIIFHKWMLAHGR